MQTNKSLEKKHFSPTEVMTAAPENMEAFLTFNSPIYFLINLRL